MIANRSRAVWFGLAGASTLVLCVSRVLVPDPIGVGTHTQLGLPPCSFLFLTGQPCPACGLTTAFAHMARGQLAHAWHTHALGVLLFVIVLASVPASVWAGVRKLPPSETFARVRVTRMGVWLAGLGILHWCLRLTAAWLR